MIYLFSVFEVVFLDIMGKLFNELVVNLLGGKVWDCVLFVVYLFYKYEGVGGIFGFIIDFEVEGWELGR